MRATRSGESALLLLDVIDLLVGQTVLVAFQGSTVKFIGREDFIAMKVFAGGPMDLVDATRAVTAAGASLDLELVRRLAKCFGKDASASLERLLKS